MKKTDIGVIGAMKIEVEALCSAMEETETEMVGGMDFVRGTLHGKSVVASKCGIGKVFAAMCAQAMILHYAPGVIINSGVAGALSERLTIGEVAIADRVVQHDMDTSALGDPVGLLSGINQVYLPTDPCASACLEACVRAQGVHCVRGAIASGDQFIHSTAQKNYIHSHFDDCIACEMEGAAIGQVCYVNGTPYAILRAISDGGDESAFADYPAFLAHAAHVATDVILRFAEVWQST